MPQDVLLGADLGTSGLKLVALQPSGRVVAEAERGYSIDRPAPGRAETDPRAWRHAFDEALAAVAPSVAGRRVLAVGLAGQMHGAVLVDAAGIALRPALLWADSRATTELDLWRALSAADRAETDVRAFAELDDELAGGAADVVVTDHHRDELGELLRDALVRPARWIGVMGNPRHEGPHVAALTALGVPPEQIARVHRPIGLDIGSRAPAEIAVSTLAGLLADRNGRAGGFAHGG